MARLLKGFIDHPFKGAPAGALFHQIDDLSQSCPVLLDKALIDSALKDLLVVFVERPRHTPRDSFRAAEGGQVLEELFVRGEGDLQRRVRL